jgi:hypothetical protein
MGLARLVGATLSSMLMLEQALSFVPQLKCRRHHVQFLSSNIDQANDAIEADKVRSLRRRSVVMAPIVASFSFGLVIENEEAFAAGTLSTILGQLKEASKMLDDVPDLIKAEKWDSGEYQSIQLYIYFSYHDLTNAALCFKSESNID